MVDKVVDGGAGDSGFENRIVTNHPRGHVAAVRPSADGDAIGVDESALLHRVDAGDHIASGPGAGVVRDGNRVAIAEVVAAAVIRLENDPVMRGERLRQKCKARRCRRARSAVDVQHEWIFSRGVEARRINEHSVFIEALVLPPHLFDSA